MKILYNARIYTLDAARPVATAIAIEHERVVEVGETDALLSEYDRAEKQDMGEKTILPGLTDAHLHLQNYALFLQKIDCETETLDECLSRVADRARTAQLNEWILGHGWNQNNWGAWPSAADLDKIAPNNPVYLTAKSLHAAWANSAALKLAGLTATSPDPINGQLQREDRGNLTGILLETAMMLVDKIIPEPSLEAIANAIEQAQPLLWRMGLTGIHDFDRRFCFMAMQQLHAWGKLKLRVTKSIPVEDLKHAVELGLRTGFGDDWLRIGSVKVFMDGALGPRTAAMFQSFENEPENKGILNMDGEELFEHSRKAADVGLAMTVHAIGDRANHEVLNAFEQLRAYEAQHNLPHLRHRLEHVQLIHPDDAPRLAKLNVIASMQPIHATSDMFVADKFWGKRAEFSYAWRTQLDYGAPLAFGSDAPVESPNPFWGLHAAITRRRADGSPSTEGWYPSQKLSLAEAFSAYTLGAAYAANAETRLGMLSENYLADLIVLDEDPFKLDPNDLMNMSAAAVMINGEWVLQ